MTAQQKACRFYVKLILLVVIAMTTLSLAGCTIKFFYQQLDWLVPWYIDKQLDLNAAQEKRLRAQVTQQLTWHRSTQVPLYINTLKSWQTFSAGPFSRQEFDRLSTETQRHFSQLSAHVLPDFKELMFTLDARQRKALYAVIEKSNKEYEKKYLGPGVKLDKVRLEETQEAVDFWLGSISKEQDKRIQRLLSDYKSTEPESMINRRNWLTQFRRILESDASSAQIKSRQMDALFFSPQDHWSQDYKNRFDANAELSVVMVEQVLSLVSSKQREHLIKRFKGWELEFRDIQR